jgi:sterol desaturase/sphingolipid hydroxylase (fatty acid hydroxylase superfamily)
MSLSQRLTYALLAIPGEMIDRGFWYLVIAGPAWVILHLLLARWLARRRISDKPNTFRQMSWEFLYSLRSVFVYGLVGGFMVFVIASGWTQMYFRIERFGWTWFFLSIGVTVLIHDTYFYWTHRLMHHPRLFRVMHHTHHLSTNPSPWAAYSFSTSEAFVQAGIAPLVIFTLPIHPLGSRFSCSGKSRSTSSATAATSSSPAGSSAPGSAASSTRPPTTPSTTNPTGPTSVSTSTTGTA